MKAKKQTVECHECGKSQQAEDHRGPWNNIPHRHDMVIVSYWDTGKQDRIYFDFCSMKCALKNLRKRIKAGEQLRAIKE